MADAFEDKREDPTEEENESDEEYRFEARRMARESHEEREPLYTETTSAGECIHATYGACVGRPSDERKVLFKHGMRNDADIEWWAKDVLLGGNGNLRFLRIDFRLHFAFVFVAESRDVRQWVRFPPMLPSGKRAEVELAHAMVQRLAFGHWPGECAAAHEHALTEKLTPAEIESSLAFEDKFLLSRLIEREI